MNGSDNTQMHLQEKEPKAASGMAMLLLITALLLVSIGGFVFGAVLVEDGVFASYGAALMIAGGLCGFVISPLMYLGLKVIKPNEALVLTLFGRYFGTLKREGFYYVNPLTTAINPVMRVSGTSTGAIEQSSPITTGKILAQSGGSSLLNKKISLKVMTLNNDKQKINDQMGNPIIIGIVVVWKVSDPTKAVFNVDNYMEYLSIQCDSALRDIVRLYPYDTFGDDNEKTLRASGQEITQRLREAIQAKVLLAGLEIIEARITHLSYAPEIAAVMLQRQQASAVIDARQMIVEGAVGMVEMALSKLNDRGVVTLDDERKAAMVSNLMVVLCGSRETQPVINSGSIY